MNSRKRTASESIVPVVPSATSSIVSRVLEEVEVIGQMTDGNQKVHHIALYPKTVTGAAKKPRRMARHCVMCKDMARKLVTTNCFCVECGEPLCFSPSKKHDRECFESHLCDRISPRILDE